MKFEVTHIPPILKTAKAIAAWQDVMETAAAQVGSVYATAVVEAIEATDPIPYFEGHLRNGIHSDRLTDGRLGSRVTVSAIAKPYAPTMELGRRPGKPGPPMAPILEWVMRKLHLTGKEAKQAAFLIRRKIHQKGIKGRGFFARARLSRPARIKARKLVLAAVARFREKME